MNTHTRIYAMSVIICLGLMVVGTTVRALPPASWDNIPEGRKQEHERGLDARQRWIAKLPQGTVSTLDVPYTPDAKPGSLPASDQTLDLYVPAGNGPHPLIVWIHGGAWKGGNKEQQGADLAAKLVPEGFAVASINYRFTFDAQFPGMFQDAIDAVAFLRANSAKYNLDPRKVGVVGISAGAHIAGVVATAEGTKAFKNTGPAVQAAVLLCGFYDMTRATGQWKQGGMIDNPRDDYANIYPNKTYDAAIAENVSPVYLATRSTPPIMIAHGDKDTIAPAHQSELLEVALKKLGRPVVYKTYPDYTHNLWKPDVHADMIEFLKKHVR